MHREYAPIGNARRRATPEEIARIRRGGVRADAILAQSKADHAAELPAAEAQLAAELRRMARAAHPPKHMAQKTHSIRRARAHANVWQRFVQLLSAALARFLPKTA